MRLPSVRFTVRDLMAGVLAVAFLLGWVVGWEQSRIRYERAAARAILAEDVNDPFARYHSQQDAIEASHRVMEQARMWADGWPDPYLVVMGAILDVGVVSLSLSISKAVEAELRDRRRASESPQRP